MITYALQICFNQKKKLCPTKKMERGKDSIDLDSNPLSIILNTQFLVGNKIIYNFKLKFLSQKNSR